MNTNKHENLVSSTQFDESPKKKFSEWENILVGSDIHSIRNQIYDMILIASKETIEELRGFWEKYRRETEQWNR